MRFYFRPGRNAATALISGAMALFSATMWWGDGSIFSLVGMLLFGAAALKGAFNALNSEPALKFDADRLWVRTTFGTQVVPWNQVYGIALQIVTIRYWGVLPVGRSETLCISCQGGALGARRVRLSARAIDLPPGGAPELVQILRDAQMRAVGRTGVAMAGAGQHGGVPSKSPIERHESVESGFDADAAIARYLASKEATPRAPAPTQPSAPVPLRPVFGRRTSQA